VIEILLAAERALSVGLVDQAERLFRQAADGDPRNSIAVVGLARVALDRGDEAGALQLARRALEIDQDNPAARRLVERLVEVAAYRGGAPVDAPPASAATQPGRAAHPSRNLQEAPSDADSGSPQRPGSRQRPGLLRRFLGRE
jgi:hypothetical protein